MSEVIILYFACFSLNGCSENVFVIMRTAFESCELETLATLRLHFSDKSLIIGVYSATE